MSAVSVNQLSKHFKIIHLKPKSLKEAFITKIWHRTLEKTEFWALKDVSFEIEPGRTVGVIGTNGSGKSTLLKVLAGILTPTEGKVHTQGSLAGLLELGAGFHPDFSGRENILMNGVMLGFTRKEINKRMDDIIAFAELEKFIDNPVKTYSSGMYMRLGFSIAVNINPDILLVDEVLAVGDYYFQKKCFQKMEEFKKNKKTIIFVSHDMGSVDQFCTEVVWLHNGKLMAYGPTKNVLNEYMNKINEERKSLAEKEHATSVGGLSTADDIHRWGTREVEITSFRLLDKDSKERYYFDSGEPVTIEIDYFAREPIPTPVFAFGLYKSDGVCCYGTNSGWDNIQFENLEKGHGKLKIEIEKMELVEGKYWFDVDIQNTTGQYYDFHYRLYSMTINSQVKDVGVYRLPHTWKLEKTTTPTVSK